MDQERHVPELYRGDEQRIHESRMDIVVQWPGVFHMDQLDATCRSPWSVDAALAVREPGAAARKGDNDKFPVMATPR